MTKSTSHRKWLARAGLLTEILPHLQTYFGHTLVVKYGGHAMVDPTLAEIFARDIVMLKHLGVHPVIVHGGGPQINDELQRRNIEPKYHNGLRITDPATMEVAEMVLSGKVNKHITAAINAAAGSGLAIGVSGRDGNLIKAELTNEALGLVGTPCEVNTELLRNLVDAGLIPVIAPVANFENQACNVNADIAAGAIAGAMHAKRLLLLTDVDGVLDQDGKLIPHLKPDAVPALIQQGVIRGGMIPKLDTCISALASGIEAAVIIDGREQHSILIELFTDIGIGTLVRP